ncbi:MAG: GerMN domain-containing protein [Deltaproteobacteria bacterium]|nr:GerMN domain-containing protein [Deltaproteobacteria bacterium]
MALKKRKGLLNKARKKNSWFAVAFLLVVFASLVFFFVILFSYLFPLPQSKDGKKATETISAVLFFPDENEEFLLTEKRKIPKRSSSEAQALEIVKELIDGPRSGGVRSFPDGAAVQSVKIKDGVAMVSFDEELIKKHPGGTTAEMMTVFSLVNSLVKNDVKIKQVRIVVNGKPIETIKGHIDATAPFSYQEMSAGR